MTGTYKKQGQTEQPQALTVTGTTPGGFQFSLNLRRLKSFDNVQRISRTEKGDSLAFFELVESVLGAEELERLKRFVSETGEAEDAGFEEVAEVFGEMLEAVGKKPFSPPES